MPRNLRRVLVQRLEYIRDQLLYLDERSPNYRPLVTQKQRLLAQLKSRKLVAK